MDPDSIFPVPPRRSINSGRYDPRLSFDLHQQIMYAKQHFRDAVARRSAQMQDAQMGLLGAQADAMQPRLGMSPFERARGMIRF